MTKSRKQQKVWKMKGCSISRKYHKGGKRRSRRNINRSRNRRGGNKMAGYTGGGIVNPFVGDAWAANVGRWPGVQGIAGVTNHFSPYNITKDPNLQSVSERDGGIFPQPVWSGRGGKRHFLYGGKRMSKRIGKRMSKRMGKRMGKTGGGIIPQDLINGGRNIMYGLGSTYNAMAGYPAPVNPLPYKDQLMGK